MPPPGQIYNNNNNTGRSLPRPLPCHLCSQSLSTTFISLPTFNVPQDEEKLGTLDSIINFKKTFAFFWNSDTYKLISGLDLN